MSKATGGEIPAHTPNPDSVPAWLSPGHIIYDPDPAKIDPLPPFKVGDRIQIGEQVVTVTAVIPHEDDATEYRVTSDDAGVSR